MLSPTVWLRPLGCDSCSMNSRNHLLGAPLSTATTLALCTSPPTPFNINAPSKHVQIDLHFVQEGRHQSCSRPPCLDNITVHRHLHEGSSLLGVQ
jgi:hypothetical protein